MLDNTSVKNSPERNIKGSQKEKFVVLFRELPSVNQYGVIHALDRKAL
jgi:hypothetical protein